MVDRVVASFPGSGPLNRDLSDAWKSVPLAVLAMATKKVVSREKVLSH